MDTVENITTGEYIVIGYMTTYPIGSILEVMNNNGMLICHEPATGNSYVLNTQLTKQEFDAILVPNTKAARVLYAQRTV